MDIKKLQEKQDRLSKSINTFQLNLEKIQKEEKEAIKSYGNSVKLKDSLVGEIKALTNDIKKLSGKKVDIGKQLNASDFELGDVLSVIEERESQSKKLQEDINRFNKERGEIKSKLTIEKDGNTIKLKEEILKLGKERDALLSGNKVVSDGNDKMKKEKTEQEKIAKELKTEVDKFNSELITQKKLIELEKGKLIIARKNVIDTENGITEIQKQNVKLGKETDKIIKDQEVEKEKLEKMKSKQISFSKQREEFNQAKEELKTEYEKAGIDLPQVLS